MKEQNLISIAKMNSFVVSTPSKPIIATHSLATCMGLLLTDGTTYTLAHLTDDYSFIPDMLNFLKNEAPLKALIIPGFYPSPDKITSLTNYLHDHNNFFYHDFDINVKELPDFKEPKYSAVSFGFDTRTKEFIKIDFDKLLKEDSYGRN